MGQDAVGEDPLQHEWAADSYYGRPHLRLRILARLIRAHLVEGARLLDIGAGPGVLARMLDLQRGYVGLDQYEQALDAATGLDLRRWSWDDSACTALVEDDPFDLVVASGFLEYIESRAAFLRRVREALRPGGIFFTSMICDRYWPRRWRRFLGRESRHACWKRIAAPPEMDALFRDAGFEAISATPVVRVRGEWPRARFSCRRRKLVRSFERIRTGPFTDQLVYELRRPVA
ncbi:MAG: class I SAM-dependent methyltransferase [Planctomycetota bacterium]|jgi:SAM-dependent methyltransferase